MDELHRSRTIIGLLEAKDAEIARLTAALADAEARTAELIAEARAEGMREAAEICWSKKDEDDFRYWGAGAVDHQLRGAMIGKQRAIIAAAAQKEAGAVKGGTISTGPHCDCGMIGPCMFKKCRHPLAANNGEAASDFPPPHCTSWEDCNHDGICHDPKCCGATGPNHEAFYGEAGE